MKEIYKDERKKRKSGTRRRGFEKREKQEKKLPKKQRKIHLQEECQKEWMIWEV